MARILVVDDDRDVAESIAQALSAVGHSCVAEMEGRRAWERVNRGETDLLVLDVMLPGLSGFELCRRIRGNPKLYALPILFLSAMDADEEVRHGLAQGADDYLTKPFSIDALLSRVVNLLSATSKSTLDDPATGLAGAKRIKLEVHKLVNERRAFSIAYLEILRLQEFTRIAGPEQRARAIRHFARGIRQCAEDVSPGSFLTGHMGGGYFAAILPMDRMEKFCAAAKKSWDEHVPKMYADMGIPRPASSASDDKKGPPVLDSLICATNYLGNAAIPPQSLFDTLSRLRQTGLTNGSGGIYVDRRQ